MSRQNHQERTVAVAPEDIGEEHPESAVHQQISVPLEFHVLL